MKVPFSKFQGNGNDFVIIDNRSFQIEPDSKTIRRICDRHFGVGADGVILLQDMDGVDFEMLYYNSDGNIASMCGNGARCIAAFAKINDIVGDKMNFMAYDGKHEAKINKVIEKNKTYHVSVSMADVTEVEKNNNFYFLDTGSPHYVEFVDKVSEINVVTEGRKTRYSERFSPEGTNVNFVEVSNDRIFVRTYERGVEDETLSCGTGVTAAAIAAFLETGKKGFQIHSTGGEFQVDFNEQNGAFNAVWLSGPAELVFEGEIEV